MKTKGVQRLALVVSALALVEGTAHAQSPAAFHIAASLAAACDTSRVHDVIFVGRPLFTGDPGALVLIPIQVETAFRGVGSDGVIMARVHEPKLDPEQSYLMHGLRTAGTDVVDLQLYAPVNADGVGTAIRLFASAMPGESYVTLFGAIEVGKSPDDPPFLPITGLRIRVSSEGFVKDLVTDRDGTFMLAGIPPGRIELKPALPATLKIFDTRELTYVAAAGECLHRMLLVVSNQQQR